MAGIRMTGMASGLPPNIVEQIMDAERIPVKNMENKKKTQEDTLKLVGDLETKVQDIMKNIGELTSTRGFTDMKLLSGDPAVIEGSVDPNTAVTGEYQVEVDQLASKPGALSVGFPDKDRTQIGVGYIKFKTPDGEKQAYISGKSSTLQGVAAQINNANVGVRATVIRDRKDSENPFRLLVTGLSTGDDKQISFPTVYMLDGDQDMYFDETREAQNAKVKIDGFAVEVPENTVKDLIPGVTLDLKQVAKDRPVRITVKENLEAISGKIKNFVDAYNGALGFIQNQHKLQKGPNGRESLGPLGGDGMLRSAESALRRVIQNPQYTGSSIQLVNELGIEFNRNGTLNFNQEKFNAKLNENAAQVALFLRGDNFSTGFVPTVKREIQGMTQTFGIIANRKKGLNDKVEQLNRRIDEKNRQLEKKEDSLRKKFSDLEQKMSGLNAQGAQVSAMKQPAAAAG